MRVMEPMETISKQKMKEQRDYWLARLSGRIDLANLRPDFPRPETFTRMADTVEVKLSEDICRKLTKLTGSSPFLLYTTLMSALKVCLYKHTGINSTAVVVGSPALKGDGDSRQATNALAIVDDIDDQLSFRQLLLNVRQTLFGAYARQSFPFERLVKDLGLGDVANKCALFDIALVLKDIHDDMPEVKNDITMTFAREQERLSGRVTFNASVFRRDTIENLIEHFSNVLRSGLENTNATVAELQMLTEAERHQLLVAWNDTRIGARQDKSIHGLFEEQVERTPDALAVVFEDRHLTYDALNRWANRLAHYLRKRGVGSEVPVGLCLERSAEMIVGLLGILKAGGAYVSLDPAYPREWLAYMLQNTQAPVLVTQAQWMAGPPAIVQRSIANPNMAVVRLDADWEAIRVESDQNPRATGTPQNVVYVIYTSGSTGQPKGVLVTHRAVVNHACALIEIYGSSPRHRLLQLISLSFDASAEEIFPALASGAALIVASSAAALLGQPRRRLIEEENITVLHLPVPLWRQWVEELNLGEHSIPGCLEVMLVGGDQPTIEGLQALAQKTEHRIKFVNAYGPTEATITSAVYETVYGGKEIPCLPKIPIGRPIANTRAYMLDSNLQPVPVSAVGKLYIGGSGLARGYLNQPAQTAERFVPDPYSPEPGGRLYETGDLVKYWPDSNIEFVGRADHQVKVRGYRIELEEVEAALKKHPAVREAVALAWDAGHEAGDKQLVAYIVQNDGQEHAVDEMQQYLRERLPEYMVPLTFLMLKELPRTPSGKVDRHALPAPEGERPRLEKEYVAPRGEAERVIAGIWQQVLHLDRVGVYDNFFSLGGHSLLVVQVYSRLKELFRKEFPMTDMFKYTTVAALAQYLSEGEPGDNRAVERAKERAAIRRALSCGTGEVKQANKVAIIGMAGRFPGADNIERFWENLRDGVEGITFFSDEELLAAGVEAGLLSLPNYVKAGTVIPGIEHFDARFFGMNPREAEVMDPQQRVFLECAWEALEVAGYDAGRYAGRIGVYAGASVNTYLLNNLYSNRGHLESVSDYQAVIGNDKDFLATQVAYRLGLKGPGVTVQTACSTSLVAVHWACQALLFRECDIALAGGVSLKVPQQGGYMYVEGGILSPDGHCRPFDAQAQGTVGSNGVGIVVLKRLADALRDRDTIHAVIEGTAVNNDGARKIGYTAPSEEGQVEVIAEALAIAGVNPETIKYVEAHGTGTKLGDPIEVAALTRAFRAWTTAQGYCGLGSVKSNIGHLDAAAGVAGLIKTVLMLQHRQIPPSLHFKVPNPKIDFANSPFYVGTALREWEADGQPRRAGVSSFGIGGTNAHVVVEEAPPASPTDAGRGEYLLTLSGKTQEVLETATANLAAYLRRHPKAALADVAYTLQVGRQPFAYRRVLVSASAEEAAADLERVDAQRVLTTFEEPRHRPLYWMFPGQGTQYVNMGRGLYEREGLFRAEVERCVELLEPHLGFNLLTVMYPEAGGEAAAVERLEQTAIAQPALFTVEYALARLWQEWGLKPEGMIGHSIGEYVAACLAGVFTLEGALELVVHRGRLIQGLPGGAMLSVALAETTAVKMLSDRVSLAAVNGPSSCTLAGTTDAIEALEDRLKAEGIASRRLHTSHAFHSAMMDGIVHEFARYVSRARPKPPKMPFVSNVTGTWIKADEATDELYWARHLRETVRFGQGLGMLLADKDTLLLEIGPGRTLSTFARQQKAETVITTLRHPQEKIEDSTFLLTSVGRLWLAGLEIDWEAFCKGEQRRRIPLPTYPFARERYWIEPLKTTAPTISPAKKSDIADWFHVPLWKQSIPPEPVSLVNQRLRWLIFCDASGLGSRVAERLEQARQTVSTVVAGDEFRRIGDGVYTINPKLCQDYDNLLDALRELDRVPHKIAHLWSVTPTVPTQSSLEEIQDRGLYSLIFLAQAVGKRPLADSIHITIVSSNMQSVVGGDALYPEKALLLGPCRVIPQEYENLTCCSVDITTPESKIWQEGDIDCIVAELVADSPDQTVAYRGGRRWVQTYEPVRLNPVEEKPGLLREGGVYLITGGLGGVGFLLAEYLARQVHAKLVLTSRSGLPPRDEWEKWAAGGAPVSPAWGTQAEQAANIEIADETWSRFTDEVSSTLESRRIENYAGLEEKLDQLCSSYAYDYLASGGIDAEKGQVYSRKEIEESLGVLPAFVKFYDFMLRILAEDRIISVQNGNIKFLTGRGQVKDSSVLYHETKETFPEFEGLLELLNHCARHYREALSGEIEALSVLYPDGSGRLLEESSRKTVEYDNTRFNLTVVGKLVRKIVERSKGRKLRILEVGAGGGGLTHHVVPALPGYDVEYHFTDIGKAFIVNAEREALQQGVDFMRFGILDISQDPVRQGYLEHSFDVILAHNVIHATRDIREALGNLEKLLAPGGAMCLIEPVRSRRCIDMIWGLAKGWWYFEDSDLRSDSPLLGLDQWEAVLREQGFSVRTYPRDEAERGRVDSGLIVAQHRPPIRGTNLDEKEWQTQARIRKVQELEALGAEVWVAKADVADQKQMQDIVNQVRERFGAIHGVIHTAVVTGGGVIQQKVSETAAAVLAPKVKGTLALEETLKNVDLDFLALCSSLSAVMGGIGQVYYCAANAFLDALAHSGSCGRAPFTVSINWDRWQDIGTAVAVQKRHKELTGEELGEAMLPQEGIEAFERILSRRLNRVLVSTRDLGVGLGRRGVFRVPDMPEKSEGVRRPGLSHARPALANDYVEPRNEMEGALVDIWQELLGIERVGIYDNFFDLGGDSLVGIQVMSRLRQKFQAELPVRVLFEEPTIAGLAGYIETLCGVAQGHQNSLGNSLDLEKGEL